jgi:putative hydroxymethylpyrimidine transport system permease protein
LKASLRGLVTIAGLLAAWWLLTWASGVPAYMLPGPVPVAAALWRQRDMLAANAAVTLAEILGGLLAGTLLGAAAAIAIVMSPALQRWLMPVLVLSQAIPVFALAPLLVLWLGFGMASKIVMAMLIIFFPVTAAFADGLRRTEPGWLDLARSMNATPLRVMLRIRIPAALPSFASGLRVATAVAPIGAVLGEWVGASSGLGYVMVEANARIQTDLMFAALTILVVMAITLWVIVDLGLRRLLYWVPDSHGGAA